MLAAVLATSITTGGILYLLLANMGDRADVRSALRRVRDFELENTRQREMLDPLSTRAIRPLVNRLVDISRRLTPAGYVASARRKLILAGHPTTRSLDAYLSVRLVTAAFAPILLVWFAVAHPLQGALGMMAMLLILVVLALGPEAVVRRWMGERQGGILAALPDTLDLLTISVEAGLGFDQALDRTISRMPGQLSDEMARMLGEMRAGISRLESLRALDERTQVSELSSFILSIIQAETFGISIGRVLRAQADEMRIKRRQLAQERAQKAPVKMLFPMMLCIFPMIFVIVLGPAVINLSEQFIGK
jgi:tight adherence protein C